MSVEIKPFKYVDKSIPEGYVCVCGKNDVRLYRPYSSWPDKLLCKPCAMKDQNKTHADQNECSIGWWVVAVPTEDGSSFWGFTSVPQDGCDWWYGLKMEGDAV